MEYLRYKWNYSLAFLSDSLLFLLSTLNDGVYHSYIMSLVIWILLGGIIGSVTTYLSSKPEFNQKLLSGIASVSVIVLSGLLIQKYGQLFSLSPQLLFLLVAFCLGLGLLYTDQKWYREKE